ncbi:aspartyl/asparaginyl beta-hydroxylase domain-containing protein [Glacieibacterium frigidum]|uniref:Aspartyl/asparaginy/proline hydroxylase domain-containing protein n=1 Tax=Glacieibacterium frigidum TaxID=2593303 RepID=A0A552U7L1_9SPHN|nr:aspartyl/asparaginyl beta-hydroxylase domain-containing protein [Glacieibacterium frigidum]TRW14205.1 hypothetical protein FMM06_10815 [Glacieibacterium frigidum]
MADGRIAQLYAAADAARAARRPDDATRHLQAVLAIDPRQPRALNMLGLQALTTGDAKTAVEMLTRAAAAAPQAIELRLNLADAQRRLGDDAGELASLNAALAIEPYAVIALLRKAQFAERRGRLSDAAKSYGAVLNIVASNPLPPELAAQVEHGRAVVNANIAALGTTLARHLADPRAAVENEAAWRFDACVEQLLGRRRVYPSQPTGLSYPGLPLIEIFPRALMPWLSELEAATADIQREFAALEGGFAPYVAMPAGTPVNQWEALNHSLDWSALFLWQDGIRNDANCARCPATAALLDRLPLLDVPGRGPAAFFSVLRPRTHIPPHVGVTNIRAVVHLPLVVPDGCGIRIGALTRQWVIGTAFAFDDTIEHEAWNDSDQPRAVLILDVWNPAIDPVERDLLRALTVGLDAHGQA